MVIQYVKYIAILMPGFKSLFERHAKLKEKIFF